MAGRQAYVYCFVPGCKNTSRSTPEKLFFPVPLGTEERRLWCTIVRRTQISSKSNVHCCQDHFNVENDVEHYTAFMILRRTGVETPHLKVKKGVRPHIFNCQPDRDHSMPIRPGGKRRRKRSPSPELEAEPSSKMLRAMLEGSGKKYQLHGTGSCASALDKAPVMKDEENHDWHQVKIKLESELILDENNEADYHLETSHHPSVAVEQSSISLRTNDPLVAHSFSSTTELAGNTSQDVPIVMVKIKEEITDDATPPADLFGSQNTPVASASSVVPLEQICIKTEHIDAEMCTPGEVYQHVFSEAEKITRDNDSLADDDKLDPLGASSASLEDRSTYPIERINIKTEATGTGSYDSAEKQHTSTDTSMMTEDNGTSHSTIDLSINSEHKINSANNVTSDQSGGQKIEEGNMGCDTILRNVTMQGFFYPEFVLDTKEGPLASVSPSSFTVQIKTDASDCHIDKRLSLTPAKFISESTVQECAPLMDYVFVDCSAIVDCEAVADSDNGVMDSSLKKESSSETFSATSHSSTGSSKTFVTSMKPETPSPSDIKVYLCNQCPAEFTKSVNLKRHSLTHTNVRPFKCNQCSADFKTNSHLTRHLLSHSNGKAFSCKQCSAQFKTSHGRTRHYLLSHSDEKAFSCNVCSSKFKTKFRLMRHLLTHGNTKSFLCSQCDAQFKRKDDLKKHSLIHSDCLSCFQCSDLFKETSELKKLSVPHSSTHGPFFCNFCFRLFKTIGQLKRHSYIHSENQIFSCGHCSARFKEEKALQKHLETHSNEKALRFKDFCAQLKQK